MSAPARPVALVTGATGGMGRAAARRLGQRYDLFLTDVNEDRLVALADSLTEEGTPVVGHFAGDIAAEDGARRLVTAARAAGTLGTVFHAAGLSPVQAGPEAILRVNLVATERLLQALESDLEPGLVAILVASMSGYLVPLGADVIALTLDPLRAGFIEEMLAALPGDPAALAYGASKRAVINIAEARAAAWGNVGGRIVSISPGLIDTPMGREENEKNPASAHVLRMTPLGLGRATDIAALAAFLASEDARYITGCDIRIDGGCTPVTLPMMRAMANRG